MKELSIEEKAKRYESALERCRKLYNEAKANEYTSDIEDYETIFPELKEDEKIRESLIHLVHLYGGEFGMIDANTSVEKAIAWLEKQGTSYTKRDVDDAYLKGVCDAKHELEKQGEQKSTDNLTQQEAMDIAVAKCFDEHNPAVKVEPKFKVKYAGSEYNVLEVKDIAGVTFYGIEDEPNHIDYVKADNCEIISGGYGIKENGSPYPTKPAVFSVQKPAWSEEDEERFQSCLYILQAKGFMGVTETINTKWLKSIKNRIKGE